MHRLFGTLIIAAFTVNLAAAPPSAAPQAPSAPRPGDVAAQTAIAKATEFIQAKRPAEALPLLNEAIAREEAEHANQKRQIYCASSPEELLMYALRGAADKKDTVVLGPEWAKLIFLKGFALIDLGRGDEAKTYLERALALSPENPQYLSELAEWYKGRRDWVHAYGLFQRALGGANLAPESEYDRVRARALRGMGYTLVEQGKLDEAEKRYRECLEINPGDEGAEGELEYIRRLKAKSPVT